MRPVKSKDSNILFMDKNDFSNLRSLKNFSIFNMSRSFQPMFICMTSFMDDP